MSTSAAQDRGDASICRHNASRADASGEGIRRCSAGAARRPDRCSLRDLWPGSRDRRVPPCAAAGRRFPNRRSGRERPLLPNGGRTERPPCRTQRAWQGSDRRVELPWCGRFWVQHSLDTAQEHRCAVKARVQCRFAQQGLVFAVELECGADQQQIAFEPGTLKRRSSAASMDAT